ncbi:MAG: tetratricopeptide repeat protein [Magnetococcales bacterium]|nr:tetratricopeptide repeat protein [Magnetococcales bacterium]
MPTSPHLPTPEEALQRAIEHHEAGHLTDAEALYRQLLTTHPQHAMAWHRLGLLALQVGQPQQASQFIGESLRLEPNDVAALCNMGHALASFGEFDTAITHLQQATALQPNMPEAHLNLGEFLRLRGAVGDLTASEASCREAIRLRPSMPEAHNNLGTLLKERKRYGEAVEAFEKALRLAPKYADAHTNLGTTYEAMGRLDEAIASHKKAIDIAPESGLYHSNLSHALMTKGDLKAARESGEMAVKLHPDLAKIHANLGQAHIRLGRPDQALICFQKATELEPNHATYLNQIGANLADMGRCTEALEPLRRASAMDPGNPELHNALIFFLDMTPGVQTGDHQQERQRWVERFLADTVPFGKHHNDPDPQRPLRVGYLSSDFHSHSAASTFGACLLHYDRTQYELFCYANNQQGVGKCEDEVTNRFRQSVDHWREISHLDDEEVTQMIRSDCIDILVDLSGHTTGNRLRVMARRPAPIQCTGWGYNLGTGLSAIDYLVIDPIMLPPEERPLFAEQAMDLPCGIHLQPLTDWPEPAPLPALTHGTITFGSFNRTCKINPELLALWGRLLVAVPESRMLFKIPKLETDFYLNYYREVLASHGVEPQRVEVLGSTSQYEHLAAFNQVDIALDPIPQGGGITSLEALRMGVPVLTLKYPTITGRLTASFCHALDLEDWVAERPEAWIAIAQKKAQDLDALAALRRGLRVRFDDSILGNHALYMHHLERLYRQMWKRWSAGQSERAQL